MQLWGHPLCVTLNMQLVSLFCIHISIFVFFLLADGYSQIEHFLDSLQSPEFLPQEMMTGYEALHFGDIHFVSP